MRKEATVSQDRPADLTCRSVIMSNFYIEWSAIKKGWYYFIILQYYPIISSLFQSVFLLKIMIIAPYKKASDHVIVKKFLKNKKFKYEQIKIQKFF